MCFHASSQRKEKEEKKNGGKKISRRQTMHCSCASRAHAEISVNTNCECEFLIKWDIIMIVIFPSYGGIFV